MPWNLPKIRRWVRLWALTLLVLVILGVWIAYEFPSLIAGRKSSLEVLEDLFQAPAELTQDRIRSSLKKVNKEAVALFIATHDLPDDCRTRLVELVRGDRVDTVTLPYLFYLYDLYGSAANAPQDVADLAYAEPPQVEASGPGLSATALFRRRHVTNALRLFDALFLRVKPGSDNLPVAERYEEQAYAEIKQIVRAAAREMLAKPTDTLAQGEREENQYRQAFEEILNDDERWGDLVEFFTDFLRELSDNWLQSFVEREHRKERRLAWVEDRILKQRYYEIADYAADRLNRKLVIHLAVDGLQGKLLQGLAELSTGNRKGAGARYLTELVREHQRPEWHPSSYPATEQTRLPPLGTELVELVDKAPQRPDFLKNFKRYFFADDAHAVSVEVATVDTPTISVRNLPIIYSGHAVAGAYGTGVPNFSYLDRRTGRGWYFWGSDVLHFRRIFANREEQIPGGLAREEGPGARTLFERLWRQNTVAAMASIDTGALEKISAEVGLALGELRRNYIEKALVLRFRQRAEVERELNERQRWLGEHRHLNHGFLAELIFNASELATFRENARWIAEREDEGLPDYLLWYNPWPDHFAHGKGPYSNEIVGYQGEYDRLDFYLGKMLQTYQSVHDGDGPDSRTALDRTLVGVVSDHGLIYTPRLVSSEKLLFETLEQDGIRLAHRKLTRDEGELPAIRGRRKHEANRPFDVVVGSTAGGSYVMDVFHAAGIQGDQAAWERHPDYHELRQHKLLSGQTLDFVQELQTRLAGVMDLAVVRENGPALGESWPPDVKNVVRVFTPNRGEARIVRLKPTATGERLYRYEVLGDRDPLDLAASIRDYLLPPGAKGDEVRRIFSEAPGGKLEMTGDRWRAFLSCTLRPDCIYQLAHLYDTDRAGTINLFPLPHVGLNSAVPGRHAGETFGEKNGTQLYAHTALSRSRIHTARNGSLPVTLYHWLVGDALFRRKDSGAPASAADEFGFPSLLPDAAFDPLR